MNEVGYFFVWKQLLFYIFKYRNTIRAYVHGWIFVTNNDNDVPSSSLVYIIIIISGTVITMVIFLLHNHYEYNVTIMCVYCITGPGSTWVVYLWWSP